MDYLARQAEFRRRMAETDAPAWYLVDKANVRYLSGFTGEDSTLLLTHDRAVLLTDSRFTEQAEVDCDVDEVACRRGPMAQLVARLCAEMALTKLCVSGAAITYAVWQALGEQAEGVDVVPRKSCPAVQMRLTKDSDEVVAVRAALDLSQAALVRTLAQVEPGLSEERLAALLDFEMRISGAQGPAFDTICAIDANASKPHAVPCGDVVAGQSSILWDWGACLDGYCSDLTRMTCVSTIPDKVAALIPIVAAAQQAGIDALRPGAACCDVDAAARGVISEAGYSEYFGHGLGHGVGLAVHEGPVLTSRVDAVLEPGMIVTVEPGIYLPGQAGVRLEQMVLITADGHEVLSSLTQDPAGLGQLRHT
jgi:Xaa-Pro aminopeptidase